jgi:hypothetical protein
VRSGFRKVDGWFAQIDADIFRVVLELQRRLGLRGAGAEIGVHHGKAFIPICLGLAPDERAWCVDVFEDQELNRDASGRGDRTVFEANLARFGVDATRVDIRQASSLDITPTDVLEAVGPVRMFSVDGGHWHDIVASDLQLAWNRSRRTRNLTPFAVGFNKLYIAAPEHAARYQRAIEDDPALKPFLVKWGELEGARLPIFHLRLEPQRSLRDWAKAYGRVMQPGLYRQFSALTAPTFSMLRSVKRSISHGRVRRA